MLNLQVEHLDETIEVFFDNKINQLNRLIYKVKFPNIPCEVCNRTWDTISPCALCNAFNYTTGRI